MEDLIIENGKIVRDQNLGALKVELNGYISTEESKQLFQHQYAMLDHYKIKKILLDSSGAKVFNSEAQKEIETVWLNNVLKAGVKYIAVVVPKDIFGKVSSDKISRKLSVSSDFEFKEFTKMEDAQGWLFEKN